MTPKPEFAFARLNTRCPSLSCGESISVAAPLHAPEQAW